MRATGGPYRPQVARERRLASAHTRSEARTEQAESLFAELTGHRLLAAGGRSRAAPESRRRGAGAEAQTSFPAVRSVYQPQGGAPPPYAEQINQAPGPAMGFKQRERKRRKKAAQIAAQSTGDPSAPSRALTTTWSLSMALLPHAPRGSLYIGSSPTTKASTGWGRG